MDGGGQASLTSNLFLVVVLCFVSSPSDKNYTSVVYLFFLQQGNDFVIVHWVKFADIVQREVVYWK